MLAFSVNRTYWPLQSVGLLDDTYMQGSETDMLCETIIHEKTNIINQLGTKYSVDLY